MRPAPTAAMPARSQAIEVYRSQLRDLDAEVARGQVPASEEKAMRNEIARRILAESNVNPANAGAGASPLVASMFALMIPAIALPAYIYAGNPSQRDTPLSVRLSNAVANNDLDAMTAQVERHLAERPDDVNGWKILASVYAQLGRYLDSANAYQQVLRLEQPTTETYAELGEALVMEGQGIVSSTAAQAFQAALALNANNPKAAYYQALALKQGGNTAAAREKFEALLQTSPADAPWRKVIQKELADLAKAPQLTEQQMAASKEMQAEDRQQMIKSMVDGLEQKLTSNGDDIDGWLRLIRARTVLGETDRAREALLRAQSLFRDKPPLIASLDALARELKLQ